MPAEAEFRQFFQENRTQLVALAYLWCGDREEAVDLAQETLTRTWERWGSVSRHPNPEACARRVLHNLCTSRWRRRKLERSHVSVTVISQMELSDAMELDVAKLVAQLAPETEEGVGATRCRRVERF